MFSNQAVEMLYKDVCACVQAPGGSLGASNLPPQPPSHPQRLFGDATASLPGAQDTTENIWAAADLQIGASHQGMGTSAGKWSNKRKRATSPVSYSRQAVSQPPDCPQSGPAPRQSTDAASPSGVASSPAGASSRTAASADAAPENASPVSQMTASGVGRTVRRMHAGLAEADESETSPSKRALAVVDHLCPPPSAQPGGGYAKASMSLLSLAELLRQTGIARAFERSLFDAAMIRASALDKELVDAMSLCAKLEVSHAHKLFCRSCVGPGHAGSAL